MEDRTAAVCDLLMAAAFADNHLHASEKQAVESHLRTLMPDGVLSSELSERIEAFSTAAFRMDATLKAFADDSKDDRKKLLEIVAAIHAADEEYDFDEDSFLLELAAGLDLSAEDAKAHTLEYQVETLKEHLASLRTSPPPVPSALGKSGAEK